MAVCPHISITVHVLVTTIGHTPVATSIYVTEVMPHASDALPLLGALSKTASVDVAVIEEKTGDVIAPVLQPVILRVTAQVAMDGGASVETVKVAEHVVVNGAHPLV